MVFWMEIGLNWDVPLLLLKVVTWRTGQLPRKWWKRCLPHSGKSIRIGITGTPGVGKSTFVEALGNYLTANGNSIAVLAIDPSSKVSQGSILGDKTRMQKLGADPNAFIRPSPAGESLGGVARQTRETILLCEAAGYEYIFVETVGVGQSETAVHSMTDFFLLLLLPGAGDELQGIKRGIVEMADLIAVNKADGDRLALAKKSKQEYRNALHLFPPHESGWVPSVHLCSALENEGIEAIWKQVLQYADHTGKNGFFDHKRRQQTAIWLEETIQNAWREHLLQSDEMKSAWHETEEKVLSGIWSPLKGATYLMELLKKS